MRSSSREQGGEEIALKVSVRKTTTNHVPCQLIKICLQLGETNLALSCDARFKLLQFEDELAVLAVLLSCLTTKDGNKDNEHDRSTDDDDGKNRDEVEQDLRWAITIDPDCTNALSKVANYNVDRKRY